MAAFNITQESEHQTDNFSQENHVYRNTVFWGRKGVLLVDFFPHGETINFENCCKTLKRLRRAIQTKRRVMLNKGILLLRDNARPHAARRTQDLIASFGWTQLDHLSYTPNFAPSYYHLILNLKKHFGGQGHNDDDSIKT